MRRIEAWKLTTTLCGLLMPAIIWAGACGGDDSAPAGKGGGAGAGTGTVGSTGLGGVATGTGGTSGTGGSGTSTGTGGVTATDAGDDSGPAACVPFAVPNANITDFTNYTATGGWGDPMSLTGGTFVYQGTGNAMPTTMLDSTAGNLVVTVMIPAGSYAGFGFYFGPACVNAMMYNGITFTMGGDAGGASAQMQIQSDEDYPVDTMNMKGHCPGTFSSGCGFPSATFTVPATPAATVLTFDAFTGGKPMTTVDKVKLVGLQWQFNCPATDAGAACNVNITMDDVHFVM